MKGEILFMAGPGLLLGTALVGIVITSMIQVIWTPTLAVTCFNGDLLKCDKYIFPENDENIIESVMCQCVTSYHHRDQFKEKEKEEN